jgi:acylphosphatase
MRKRIAPGSRFVALCQAGTDGEVNFLPANRPTYGTLARVSGVGRKQMRVLYSGRVQGVGFRYAVRQVASGFEVTGTVRNLPDGRVELFAEGSGDELQAFQQAIRESGMDHFIQNEQVSWGDAKNEFRGFEIVR